MIAAYRTIASNGHLVRLFIGEFVSGIGDWLYLVALLVVVYRDSEDPFLLGVVGGARIIPYIVLSVPAGYVVDHFDRRKVLIVTDLLRGFSMIGLAINTFNDGPVLLTVGLAIFATVFAVFFRPSIGAYLPSLVRNEQELGPANSVFATLGEATFVLGPAIGGVIIAATDLGWAFALNALTFLAPVVMLWSLPPNDPRAARAARAAKSAEGGARDAQPDGVHPAGGGVSPSSGSAVNPRAFVRPVAGLAFLDLVAGFLYGGISVALVIFAVDRLGAGEDATGYLWAAIGVGGVLGAVGSSAVVLRPNLGPVLMVGAFLTGLGFIALGFVTVLTLAFVALIVVAAGSLLAQVVNDTVVQRVVPDEVRGRTLGTMQTVSTLTYAAGSFAVPVLLTSVGAPVLMGVGGAAILAASFVTFALVGDAFKRGAGVEEAATVLARVARLPLFAGVSPAALEVAAQRLVPVTVKAGDVIVREGDAADCFYIIERGEFAVDQLDRGTGSQRRLRVMGPDDVFGELGLMHNAPRSATVTANGDGRLLALAGADFLELLNAGPELESRMLARYRVGSR